MDTGLQDTVVGAGFPTAVAVTLCGGILMFATEVLPLPAAVFAVGLGAFITGTLLITTLAIFVSRATGKSVAMSVCAGARIALRWVWLFMP